VRNGAPLAARGSRLAGSGRGPIAIFALLVAVAACDPAGTAEREDDRADDPHAGIDLESADPRDAFFAHLQAQCNQAFAGGLGLEPEGDPMLTGTEELVAHFRECTDTEVRIPFHVELEDEGEWDRSRSWYVIHHGDSLELRHDHREPDGSESTRTWYGGFSAGPGTPFRHDFASPERTERAGVPVGWRIEIEPGERYSYGTTLDGDYDWRVDFDLSEPVAEPPPPWGHDTPPSREPGPP
jgi:hypothetical protein